MRAHRKTVILDKVDALGASVRQIDQCHRIHIGLLTAFTRQTLVAQNSSNKFRDSTKVAIIQFKGKSICFGIDGLLFLSFGFFTDVNGFVRLRLKKSCSLFQYLALVTCAFRLFRMVVVVFVVSSLVIILSWPFLPFNPIEMQRL